MKLKVLKYAQAVLPKLFESIEFDKDGYVVLDKSNIFDLKLCHDEAVIKDYIDNIKEISECDAIISEFKQISKLIEAVKLKGINLMNSGIIEAENKKKNQNTINKLLFRLHDYNILFLQDIKKGIHIFFTGNARKNDSLLKLAIAKRSELAWKKGYVKGFYYNYCAVL